MTRFGGGANEKDRVNFRHGRHAGYHLVFTRRGARLERRRLGLGSGHRTWYRSWRLGSGRVRRLWALRTLRLWSSLLRLLRSAICLLRAGLLPAALLLRMVS